MISQSQLNDLTLWLDRLLGSRATDWWNRPNAKLGDRRPRDIIVTVGDDMRLYAWVEKARDSGKGGEVIG